MYYGESVGCSLQLHGGMFDDVTGGVLPEYRERLRQQARRAVVEKLMEQLEIEETIHPSYDIGGWELRFIWRPKAKQRQVVRELIFAPPSLLPETPPAVHHVELPFGGSRQITLLEEGGERDGE